MSKEPLSEGIMKLTSWGKKVRYIWSICPECSKGRWVDKKSLEKSIHKGLCSHCYSTRRGERHANWKGGRLKESTGYIKIWLYPDDFFYSMCNSKGYVFEHRLIVAKALGRCLHRWEVVHHKGTKYPTGSKENRADNRYPENLQLVTDDRHRQITKLECRITLLESELNKLKKENKLIKWQVKELNTQLHQAKSLR